jgi:putative methyltransferase
MLIGRRRKMVLISEPNAVDTPAPFLPYMWAILKSYWQRHGDRGSYEWLDPIFLNEAPADLCRPYRHVAVDVLGLSCYTWNWRIQCGIAQEIKARNPNCVVIAGGPDPDYKDPEFFHRYPYVDAIAVKDGEITFSRILSNLAQGDRDLRGIGGLYLPGADGRGHIATGPADVPDRFDHSPYADQSAYLERLIKRQGVFHATWETNRGCPYACSFCDWGSNTMSKVRRFDMQRVEADLDWLGRNRIAMAFSADANFGILPRDLEIADRMNEVRNRYGFPKYLTYSAAKNHPDRAIAIAKKFAETGICPTHSLSIQHTDEGVLAATSRANISAEKQVEAAKALLASRILIDVQLIVGIPGDTRELWRTCLGDLMEWGIHEEYYTFFYHVLPNAPAGDAAFLANWEVETIDRTTFSDPRRHREKAPIDRSRQTKSRLIVKSKTFSRDDWVAMATHAALVKAMHNASLTRLIALYLRLTHGVPYAAFYRGLADDFFAKCAPAAAWHQRIVHHYRDFLQTEEATDHLEVEELPRLPFLLDPSRWLVVQVCLQVDRFFDALRHYLLERYPHATHLESVIHYQKNVVILPTYNRRLGKTFRTDFDWIEYFERAWGRTGAEALSEPAATPGAVVEVTDQTCGERSYLLHPLDWGSGDWDDRCLEWITHTVLQRNSVAKNNFQQLRLHASDRVAGAGA